MANETGQDRTESLQGKEVGVKRGRGRPKTKTPEEIYQRRLEWEREKHAKKAAEHAALKKVADAKREAYLKELKAEKETQKENASTDLTKAPKWNVKKFGEEGVQPGDNSRFIRFALASWDLPPIDISDPKQVEGRILEYFEHCNNFDRKPTPVGVANWLGVNRMTLNNWKNGKIQDSARVALIQKVMSILEEQWTDYMQNGKINPAAGIFLGKNLYGYRDVQDIRADVDHPFEDEPNADMLKAKYAEIPLDADGDVT